MASSRATACQPSQVLHELAELQQHETGVPWTHSLQYVPPRNASAAFKRDASCAQAAFEEYMCSLPTASEDALPSAMGGVDSLRFGDFGDAPPTIAKFLARTALLLYVSSTAERAPFRYVMPFTRLTSWEWRPDGSGRSSCSQSTNAEAWFYADVCTRYSRAVTLTPAVRTVMAHIAQAARGVPETIQRLQPDSPWVKRSSSVATQGIHELLLGGRTHAGAWWAGQCMRLVLSSAGPCGVQLRRQFGSLVNIQPTPRPLLTSWAKLGSVAGPAIRVAAPTLMSTTCNSSTKIAVHIRRGDACMRWAERGDGRIDPEGDCGRPIGRPCYTAEDYVAAANDVLRAVHRIPETPQRSRRSCASLLLASDSSEAINDVQRIAFRAGYGRIYFVRTNRGQAWGGASELASLNVDAPSAENNFIEIRRRRGLVNTTATLGSALADIDLLAGAHAFVGTSASWQSRLFLLAIAGRTGALPPFVMVDRPHYELWYTLPRGELCGLSRLQR